ncbi:hypothetical protein OG426_01385 [Streptomyces canus]|uniref:hypothetical protein n=1 Tax=Streptomyces canus TaxID=58343 RepID=UPI00386A649A|nr:hypothetical protein OG426_01385 [Streptomyces canus]
MSTVRALVYHGPGHISWDTVPDPAMAEATDAIVQYAEWPLRTERREAGGSGSMFPEAVSIAGKAATRSGEQLMGGSHEGWSADRRR